MKNDSKKLYEQRENKRRLNAFPAYNSLNLAAGASLGICLFLLFCAFDFKTGALNTALTGVSMVYLAPAVLAFLVALRIKREILLRGKVENSTRRMGFALILFALSFNVFCGVAGFTLINSGEGGRVDKARSVEYTLSFYAALVSISTIVISSFNVFKPYFSGWFFYGIGLLLLISAFYLTAAFLSNKWARDKTVDKRMLPVAVISLLTAVTGNLFALFLGIVIITKIRYSGKSIEWIDITKRLFRNNMSMIGMFVVTFLLSLSVCSVLTFDYSVATDNNYQAMLLGPSLMFPFGTDEFGRCVFTRIVFGARISLIVGVASTALPIVLGGLLGAVAGHYGSKADNVIMRALDVLYAVPGILLAIVIISAFGTNTMNLILALSIGAIPMYARTMRASVLSVSNNEFIEAARACGAKNYQIILKHIVPNSFAPIIVRATLGIGSAALSTSSLSFLGLGVEPHIPEWGNILKTGSKYLEQHPNLAIFPGVAIVLIVLAFNYFGDGLRDALDPKLK
ncbi:MAG: ABC transporter permease [Clostridiales bacterium]|jgi:peptide/nickel transport system permease protein|nr:ABC transporter permease [Clostridiales bacterium]